MNPDEPPTEKVEEKAYGSEREVLQAYEQLTQDCDAAKSKIHELKLQAKEHELVVEAIRDMDPKRKCFRMIGGVLVERTVGEVLPAVKGNKEQLEGVVKKIDEQLTGRERELMRLRRKYKIRQRGEPEMEDEEEEEKK